MITSKQIISFCEEYLISGKAYGKQFDVYENPTSSDIVKLNKTAREDRRTFDLMRFIADAKTKKVYIADAHLANHEDIEKSVGIFSRYLETPWLLEDMVKITGGRPKMDSIMSLVDPIQLGDRVIKDKKLINWFNDRFSYDWSFVDNYIGGVSNAMKFYQEKYQKAVEKNKNG